MGTSVSTAQAQRHEADVPSNREDSGRDGTERQGLRSGQAASIATRATPRTGTDLFRRCFSRVCSRAKLPAHPETANSGGTGIDRSATVGGPRWRLVAGVAAVIIVVAVFAALHLVGVLGPGSH